ncbi:hypothetical protein K1719_006414 [Acacia pycnantha]|nr:hypothetical protein K1719_006414 [Acacia pycnantha]
MRVVWRYDDGKKQQIKDELETVLAALFCCYILFLLYSIIQQASSPWELKYHASRDGGALTLDEYNSRLGCCSSLLL